MSETKAGVFSRSKNPFVEIGAYRSDNYSTFVKRAAKKLQLQGKPQKILSLFKLNVARVLDEEVTIKDKTKPWTLGNYLLVMRKSPNVVKLGIGYVTYSDSSSSPSSEKVHVNDNF